MLIISLTSLFRWNFGDGCTHSGTEINTFNFFIPYARAYSYNASAIILPAMQPPHARARPSGLSLPYQCDRDGGECSGCRNSHRSIPCGLEANPLTGGKKNVEEIVEKVKRAESSAVLSTLPSNNPGQHPELQSLFNPLT